MGLYTIKKINKLDLYNLNKVLTILRKCGKNMKEKYGLRHWYNPWLKDVVIVLLCSLKNHIFLIEDSDKRFVATYQLRIQGEKCHLCKLATMPSFSGNGVGSFCIKSIEQEAKRNNCKSVVFEVYEESQHAICFYENRGYKKIGTLETLRYKEVIMEKEL